MRRVNVFAGEGFLTFPDGFGGSLTWVPLQSVQPIGGGSLVAD
jgi:hypothetical protein